MLFWSLDADGCGVTGHAWIKITALNTLERPHSQRCQRISLRPEIPGRLSHHPKQVQAFIFFPTHVSSNQGKPSHREAGYGYVYDEAP